MFRSAVLVHAFCQSLPALSITLTALSLRTLGDSSATPRRLQCKLKNFLNRLKKIFICDFRTNALRLREAQKTEMHNSQWSRSQSVKTASLQNQLIYNADHLLCLDNNSAASALSRTEDLNHFEHNSFAFHSEYNISSNSVDSVRRLSTMYNPSCDITIH